MCLGYCRELPQTHKTPDTWREGERGRVLEKVEKRGTVPLQALFSVRNAQTMEQLHRMGRGSGCGFPREPHQVLNDGLSDLWRVLSERGKVLHHLVFPLHPSDTATKEDSE